MARRERESARLLVVDDNRLHLLALHEILSQEGFDVDTALSGDEAITLLEDLAKRGEATRPVDVALLDLDLGQGRMDGIELARAVLDRFDIPIVFHTAHSDRSVLDRARQVASYGFVHKGLGGEHFVIATVRNAIRLHQAERERERQREDVGHFFLHATVGLVIVDADGTIVRVNPAFCTMLDAAADEIVGRSIQALTAREHLEQDLNLFNRMLHGETDSYRLHTAFIDAAGTARPAHVVVSARRDASGTVRGAFMIAHDTGGTHGLEPELAQLQEQYSLLAYSANDVVALVTTEGRMRYATPVVERMLGFTPEELRTMPLQQLVAPSSLGTARAAYRRWTAEDRSPLTLELQLRRKDGSLMWGEVVITPVTDAGGGVSRLLVTVRDITIRRAAEAARRGAEERFRRVVEQTVDPVFLLDTGGLVVYASPSSREATGYRPDELAGRTLAASVVDGDRSTLQHAIDLIVAGRETVAREITIRRRDGRETTHDARCGPLVAADGSVEGILVTTRDVTRERELLREKDALLGEVHHRVKNNLQILSSIISLMMHEQACVPILAEIQARIGVVGRLHEMLQTSHDATSIDLAFYLKGLIDQVIQLAPVQIEPDYHLDAARIDSARAIKIGLVTQELVSNAVEHGLIPLGGGALRVTLRADSKTYTLSVANPAPPATRAPASGRTGLSLIEILVEELGGSWSIDRGETTTTEIAIPRVEP